MGKQTASHNLTSRARTKVHTRACILCYTVLAVLFENGLRVEQVERVLRSKMEWPSTARRPTDKLSGPTERAPPLVLFRVLLSLYLSRSLMTIWDCGAHASVDLCICARYLITSQFSPRKFESNNDGGKLERFNPLGDWRLHMSERATKRKADTASYGMPYHQYLQGWQEHRLLHLDQGTRAVLGAHNAPLQETVFVMDLVFCYLIVTLKSERCNTYLHTYIHTFLKPILMTQEPQKHRNLSKSLIQNFHRHKAFSLRKQNCCQFIGP